MIINTWNKSLLDSQGEIFYGQKGENKRKLKKTRDN